MDGTITKKWTGRRLAAASGVAIVSFAAVGYAASLTVTTGRVGAGSATVSSCNASASVSYATAWSGAASTYIVSSVSISATAACANKPYRVTLTGTGSPYALEKTGTLDASGNATASTSADNPPASTLTGVQLVITD